MSHRLPACVRFLLATLAVACNSGGTLFEEGDAAGRDHGQDAADGTMSPDGSPERERDTATGAARDGEPVDDALESPAIYACQTGAASSAAKISFDPETFTTGQPLASNSLTDWLNAAGEIASNSHWTANPASYFQAGDSKDFLLLSKTCSRDMEITTWTRNGYTILRYDAATGAGIYFTLNLEAARGQLEVGIVTGAGSDSYRQGTYYQIYFSEDLASLAPTYTS